MRLTSCVGLAGLVLVGGCESTGVAPLLDLGPRSDVADFDGGPGVDLGSAADGGGSADALGRLDFGLDSALDRGLDEGFEDGAPPDGGPPLPTRSQGAEWLPGWLSLGLYAPNAERVAAWIYAEPKGGEPVAEVWLEPGDDGVWRTLVAADDLPAGPLFYGYRLWGPNWRWDPEWRPGTERGFVTDVDDDGHRFNPNKLVVDPLARELSHDPFSGEHRDGRTYSSGEHRAIDSGPVAPKGIIWRAPEAGPRPAAPTRPFRDEVVYEVHLRGLTRGADDLPEAVRGTYAGAALKAAELRALGVTAVELLPLHETQNEQNDWAESTAGANYWGYSSLSFFAPERRFAADRSPGGPTAELRAMVDAFHAEGLKVYVDVVFNHSGEGGAWDEGAAANLWSWRGVDNAVYYQTVGGRGYHNNNGVGPNLRMTHPQVRRMIIESLRYWHEELGVDGFRFDLAPVLGNGCDEACFRYDGRNSLLGQIAAELPVRPAEGGPGIDLIAEPWAIGPGTYQVGNFPAGWAEWNDQYRDALRIAENRLNVEPISAARLSGLIHGSSDLFRDDGRQPWHSVNFVVAPDGLTLFDLYACDGKNNGQAWPYGPSDGGTDRDLAWDHGGDGARQRQAARTGLALLMLSAGVPMMTGGDEVLRSLRCNNNPYNLDSPANWLSWDWDDEQARFRRFTARLLAFRAAHTALRPPAYTEGVDPDGNGLRDITWFDAQGPSDLAGGDPRFLAWRLDGEAAGDPHRSIYVAWNWDSSPIQARLPAPGPGHTWRRVLDTADWMAPFDNIYDPAAYLDVPDETYEVAGRAVVVLVEGSSD